MNNQLNDLVSVVVPTYSRSTMLIRAISSLNEQTYRPLEIVIVDDNGLGSAQQLETKRRIDSFSCNPGIELNYVAHELNKGGACARNTGIKNAKGEYIAFLDADDWWEPDKLAAQLALLERTGAPLCYSARQLHEADGTPTGRTIRVPERVTYEQLLYTNVIPCGSVVMRTDIAKEFYMSHAELHEDYILWLQVLKAYGAAVGIDEPYLHCRLSEGGKSRNKLRSAQMQYGVYRLMGFGIIKSMYYLCSYAWHGVKKYYGS